MISKTFALLLIALLALPLALAQKQQLIAIKTNEKVTITYDLTNRENDTLSACLPVFSGELRDTNWISVSPHSFGLGPEQSTSILVVIDRPPVGYYQDLLKISCERSYLGQSMGRIDVVSPTESPLFSILSSMAGEGQSYAIKPLDNTYAFVAKPGETKVVDFQIANTGSVPLQVDMSGAATKQGALTLEPNKFVIPVQDVTTIRLTYKVPSYNFTKLNDSFKFQVGDYQETFLLVGDSSFVGAIGGTTFSLFGESSLSGIKIPNWILAVLLAGGLYYLFVVEKVRPWEGKLKRKK